MNNWKKCKLGDIAEVIGGGTPSTKVDEYWNGDIAWITPKDLTSYNKVFISKGARSITELGLSQSSAKLMPKGTVLLTSRAPIGYVAIAENEISTNQGFKSLIPKENLTTSRFLYYWLKNNVEYLKNFSVGTTFAEISGQIVKEIEILLPPLEEQRQIAAILSSIDDKIELLHEQNKTLEELAQTLFVNWFKDREFNSTISDFISIQNGFVFKSKDFIDYGDNGVIKIKNISNGIVDIVNTDKISQNTINEVNNKFNINSGDILFAMTGAEIGKMGIVPSTNKKLWLNQRVGMLKERFLGARFLAYIHLTSEFGYDYVINSATGSAQENISATDIENCPFVKLTSEEIVSYSKQLNDFFEKIIFNLGEIQTLENMRDILIPKLLNGEIKITN
ncbi:TPA: restriction endonuclease subunit S [Campylobacter jejuni]|uniref:Restriction endonuclease subunit S n=1 Tax=Campylobacter jejuni TaxID=197 RepID=A0A5Y6RJL7_CAMJU|nr:restriction endonuclease subunit S [Campylobacter jejuni]EAH5372109.1 restriction endonuclease subunit S [Campylobacter jejuni]EAH5900277.1 restriction endonuclease subunit S [Campylobacter jejuni]EAH6267762.1 restriction endonuclease subunit S [Campylobacter jejuni]EAH6859159.1 restriction endonuclease subunit S [Campylobacter jejuni]EAH8612353.1 restriction endonuclease subunit S [Campylobacter jejuni]